MLWREPVPGLSPAPWHSPPLALWSALWETSHIPQTSHPSTPPTVSQPLSTPGFGHAPDVAWPVFRRIGFRKRPWNLTQGHLVMAFYSPRYLECGLEGDEAQALSGRTACVPCTPHPVERGMANGGPKWGLLSYGSQSWSSSYRFQTSSGLRKTTWYRRDFKAALWCTSVRYKDKGKSYILRRIGHKISLAGLSAKKLFLKNLEIKW